MKVTLRGPGYETLACAQPFGSAYAVTVSLFGEEIREMRDMHAEFKKNVFERVKLLDDQHSIRPGAADGQIVGCVHNGNESQCQHKGNQHFVRHVCLWIEW